MYEYDLETNTEIYIPNDTPELFNTPLEDEDFTTIESILESLGISPKMTDNRTAIYNPRAFPIPLVQPVIKAILLFFICNPSEKFFEMFPFHEIIHTLLRFSIFII